MNLVAGCAASLQAIAARSPRVHCITNAVAMTYTANMLLAVGAVPSMSLSPDEIAAFVGRADALLVNLGTLDAARWEAIALALAAVGGKPWALDPVLADAAPPRRRYALEWLARGPTVIRGNAAEIAALSGSTEATERAAEALARSSGAVVAQTGAVDRITDGRRSITVANGHPLMARVTAMGCAGSALLAAFLAVESDPLAAAAQALLALGVAGELAAATAAGPGSLSIALLDRLYALDEATLMRWGRINQS